MVLDPPASGLIHVNIFYSRSYVIDPCIVGAPCIKARQVTMSEEESNVSGKEDTVDGTGKNGEKLRMIIPEPSV